jgi:hypothetical protein
MQMQFNRDRYFDLLNARWYSQDPIGFRGGDYSLYRYVGNGPTNGADPSGLAAPLQRGVRITEITVDGRKDKGFGGFSPGPLAGPKSLALGFRVTVKSENFGGATIKDTKIRQEIWLMLVAYKEEPSGPAWKTLPRSTDREKDDTVRTVDVFSQAYPNGFRSHPDSRRFNEYSTRVTFQNELRRFYADKVQYAPDPGIEANVHEGADAWYRSGGNVAEFMDVPGWHEKMMRPLDPKAAIIRGYPWALLRVHVKVTAEGSFGTPVTANFWGYGVFHATARGWEVDRSYLGVVGQDKALPYTWKSSK